MSNIKLNFIQWLQQEKTIMYINMLHKCIEKCKTIDEIWQTDRQTDIIVSDSYLYSYMCMYDCIWSYLNIENIFCNFDIHLYVNILYEQHKINPGMRKNYKHKYYIKIFILMH